MPLVDRGVMSLWLFALTNTEIAIYLALAAKRASFAFIRGKVGVFAPQTTRQRQFGLKENAWRSARDLHAFGVADRQLDAGRDPLNGKVTDFGARWKTHEVMPTTFTVCDVTREKPAIATIDQILLRPIGPLVCGGIIEVIRPVEGGRRWRGLR